MKVTEWLWWKTTQIKMTSVNILLCVFLTIATCMCSCQNNIILKEDSVLETPVYLNNEEVEEQGIVITGNYYKDRASSGIYSFDFNNIKITSAQVLDMDIRNFNLYMDAYGNLIILGEILNFSDSSKTDIEITFEFIGADGRVVDTSYIQSYADYIQPGKRLPFYLVYDDVDKYMDISVIKIGVNYNSYNKEFDGFPIISGQNFYYKDNTLIIEGDIENIGKSAIEDLKLLSTFYDLRDRVVFFREGFLQQEKLSIYEKQGFQIRVLLDEYIQQFTHYRIGVFFRDSFKVEEI